MLVRGWLRLFEKNIREGTLFLLVAENPERPYIEATDLYPVDLMISTDRASYMHVCTATHLQVRFMHFRVYSVFESFMLYWSVCMLLYGSDLS